MFKALIKKQFYETLAFLFLNGKDGKKRSPLAMLGFSILMVYAFGSIGAMFWLLGDTLCVPLVQSGLGWLYFALMGGIATTIGVIGSVFITKSKLYEAKDNELLLSMPISPKLILLSRMLSLYLFTLLFEALVLVPAFACYMVQVGVTFTACVFQILIFLVSPFGALAICCLLGWLLSVLTAKLPKKNLFTILLFLVFFIGYFYLYEKVNDYLNYVLMHGEAVGETIKTVLFPLWKMGQAAQGGVMAFVWFALIFIGMFAIVYLLLSVTFLRIITAQRGEAAPIYKEKEVKKRSVSAALFVREFRRLIKSPIYLLNASLGSIMTVLFAVLTVINGDLFGIETYSIGRDYMALIFAVTLCFIAVMNIITASSVSLEGETLWQVRVLPVDSWHILKAKIHLHFVVSALPAVFATIIMGITLEVGVWYTTSICILSTVCVTFAAAMGLAVNLKFPNLKWTNEAAAVKQSASVMIAMFGGMGAVLLLLGGYFLFGRYLPAMGYIWICCGILLLVSIALLIWLKKRGIKIFESL